MKVKRDTYICLAFPWARSKPRWTGQPGSARMLSIQRASAPVFPPAHSSLPLLSHWSSFGLPPFLHKHKVLLACHPQLQPCSPWSVLINHRREECWGGSCTALSLSCVLADTRSSHILVLKTWLPLYHCLQTGHSCSQQHQLSWGSNKLSLSLPLFHICGCRGWPKWRSGVSYTTAVMDIPASGTGTEKAKVKASKKTQVSVT